MRILDEWLNDIPEQFKRKKNIEILFKAFSRKLEEVKKVFEDINKYTDIDTAIGVNLDGVGDILSLTRRDATEIIREASNYELHDELYRKILKYQKLKLSSECTYDDIMSAILLIWNVKDIRYIEDEKYPDTIFLKLSDVDIDGIDPAIGRVLSIKPAGVAVYYKTAFITQVFFQTHEKFYVSGIQLAIGGFNSKEDIKAALEVAFKVNIPEKFISTVVTRKELWRLNGEYKLDGVKLLNAIEKEEVL